MLFIKLSIKLGMTVKQKYLHLLLLFMGYFSNRQYIIMQIKITNLLKVEMEEIVEEMLKKCLMDPNNVSF